MAKFNSSIAITLCFLFTLSLLIVSIPAESRVISGGIIGAQPTLQCDVVHGVVSGDTCFDIANIFKLTTAQFTFINPNVNCSGLFVGQWLCIHGFLS